MVSNLFSLDFSEVFHDATVALLLEKSFALVKYLSVGDFPGLLLHNPLASPTATLLEDTPIESTIACIIAV